MDLDIAPSGCYAFQGSLDPNGLTSKNNPSPGGKEKHLKATFPFDGALSSDGRTGTDIDGKTNRQ